MINEDLTIRFKEMWIYIDLSWFIQGPQDIFLGFTIVRWGKGNTMILEIFTSSYTSYFAANSFLYQGIDMALTHTPKFVVRKWYPLYMLQEGKMMNHDKRIDTPVDVAATWQIHVPPDWSQTNSFLCVPSGYLT